MANQQWYTYTLLGSISGGERVLIYDGTSSRNITPTTLRTFMQAGLAAAPPTSAALLGTTSGGVFQAVTLGTNLSLTGTTLNAAGGGGATPPASAPLLGSTSGSAFQAITLGTNLSITSNVLSAGSGAAEGGTSTKVAIVPSASYPIGNEFGANLNAAITAVGAGGIVKVYPKVGGYTQTVPIVCTNGATVEGQGMVQVNFNVGSSNDAVTFGNSAVDDSILFPMFSGFYFNGGSTNCRDVFRVSRGIQLRVSRMLLSGSSRDGFHMEVAFDGDYIECCHFDNIKTWNTQRNSFHMETGTASTPTLSYINQTTFVNCNARFQVAGNSLKLVVGRSSDSHKISEVEWINGELDSANSTAPDGVSMTAAAGATIENIHFQGVAIEDSNTGTHTGHAINTGGTGSATTTNCILSGFTGGGII